jgi:hypothetical protein
MSVPAAVSRPIFIRSRLLKPAAINSRRFSAAVSFSFSRPLFLLEMYAIEDSVLKASRASR